MKDFLIDVPVKINIWIRPECQKKQWDIIKQACPSILFIQSDGGRTEEEWKKINENRKMIDESIDWKCQVYRFYESENLGLYAMGQKVNSFIWQKVDRCIFTEDDQIMSLSFFKYCKELLERYKDDERIECICGMNHLGINSNAESDYFFSRQGSIWGFATWRRVGLDKRNFDYFNNEYAMKLMKRNTKDNKMIWKRLNAYGKGAYYEGHVAGKEFWFEFDMYSQNRLQIIPKYNLIRNIGNTEDAMHSNPAKYQSKYVKKIHSLDLYEMDFPLKYNDYVIPDYEYERKRNKLMLYNHPFLAFISKIKTLLLALVHFDFDFIFKKVKNKSKKNIEK